MTNKPAFVVYGKLSILVVAFVLILNLACGDIMTSEINLAIINAKAWTGNPEQPTAQALAVSGKKIVAIGTTPDIQALTSDKTYVIDAEGMMVVPGFIDSHVHFLQGGFRLSSVQLRNAKTQKEFIKRIADYAKTVEPGTWITGGDWDHSLWGGELPRADWIDEGTPENPVWINRLDGHMSLANSAAMKLAGISKDTPDIAGGSIVRDKNGNPTGIFKDNAMALINKVVPEQTAIMKDRALEAAMKYVAEQGVTSVHHMGTWADLDVFERANKSKKLKTRILLNSLNRGRSAQTSHFQLLSGLLYRINVKMTVSKNKSLQLFISRNMKRCDSMMNFQERCIIILNAFSVS